MATLAVKIVYNYQICAMEYIQVISLCQLAMSTKLNVSFMFVIVMTSTLKGEGGLYVNTEGGLYDNIEGVLYWGGGGSE